MGTASESEDPFRLELRKLILEEAIDRPLVFRGIHKDWEPCKWTLDNWGELFVTEKLTVRYGKQKWDNLVSEKLIYLSNCFY
jgi:hypothetical protein